MKTLDALISCGPYEGAIEESICAFKYGGRRELAKPLARELAVAYVRLPKRPDVFTWVPMHLKDRLWRGFNHAELLAKELGRIVKRPARALLTKCRQVPPQVNLNPIARALNVQGCLKLAPRVNVEGLAIAVVDDVCCSGATLFEAARALKEAGAKRVYGLVLAESSNREEIVAAIRRRLPEFGK